MVNASNKAIKKYNGFLLQKISTAGGTSDGRFIAAICQQIVELGPINELIHKVNECVSCEDLNTLSTIYGEILFNLLCKLLALSLRGEIASKAIYHFINSRLPLRLLQSRLAMTKREVTCNNKTKCFNTYHFEKTKGIYTYSQNMKKYP